MVNGLRRTKQNNYIDNIESKNGIPGLRSLMQQKKLVKGDNFDSDIKFIINVSTYSQLVMIILYLMEQ